LVNAGHSRGDIYWFTDGIDNYDIQDITDWSRSNNHRLNILGVGTKSGAPIKLNNGELMKDNSGSIIVPKLSISALKGSAKRGQGNYATLANNNNDIEQLLSQPFDIDEQEQKESSNTGDQWQEVGPYLLLLVLLLLLPYFRRGRLLAILPVIILITPVEKGYAQSSTFPTVIPSKIDANSVETPEQIPSKKLTSNFWDDLWQTKDQQGQKQFNSEAFQQAANSFENTSWQGSSFYRSGNYEKALEAFQQQSTAEALYNQGNALAQLKRVDEAIEAYEQALKKDPQHDDAKANKAYLEELKKQQEQQKDQQQQNQDKNQDKNNDENQESQNKDQEQKNSDDPSQENSSEQQGDNKEGDDKEQSEEEKAQQEEQKKAEQEKKSKEEQAKEAKENNDEKSEKTPAQLRAEEKLAEETEQKHQQLLNKVTDDPYMLLRNKMQLEYQKRRNNRSSAKGTKQW
jgi:Ca-activated chloride channel family protein